MSFQLTTTTKKLLQLRKRLKIIAGGTSAGKTISVLQILIDKAQSDTKPTLTSIVSESFPHLRRGAMRDFLNIIQSHGYYDDKAWSKTEFIYTFPNGSKIEFFSGDQPSKVRGPRRDRLFLNECNNVPFETYDQLAVRTREEIWLDYNPTAEFWAYTEVMPHHDHDFVTVTYKDNEALELAIVAEIESHKHNKMWWRVYGLGLLGEVSGRVYTGWRTIDSVPHEAELVGRGLDFGFTNDPSSLVAVYRHNGGYILDEELYKKGLFVKDIAAHISNLPMANTLVIADSASPQNIADLRQNYGLNIVGAEKKVRYSITGVGAGSKKTYLQASIEHVQTQRISVTKSSLNLLKEYRSYMWKVDKDDKVLNQPAGGFDHALDAVRYVLYNQPKTYEGTGEFANLDKDFNYLQKVVDPITGY